MRYTTNFTIRQIAEQAGVSKSAVHDIWKHAQKKARAKKVNSNPPGDNPPDDNPSGDNPSGDNPSGDNPSSDNLHSDNPINGRQGTTQMEVTACRELSLVELLSAVAPDKPTGRPQALTEDEKDHLVATVKRDFETRRMTLVELQCEAGLGHDFLQTILRDLNERGLKCYREEFEFILNADNKLDGWPTARHGRTGRRISNGPTLLSQTRCPLTSAGLLGSRRCGGRMRRSGIRLVLGR